MTIETGFTIAVAQTGSTRGDVAANAAMHARVMEVAASAGANLLVFPELSLTGYELDLAESLQMDLTDPVLAPLQAQAQATGMLTLIGLPLKAASGKPYIGVAILGHDARRSYAKVHVHTSEDLYFQSGTDYHVINHKGAAVGMAICADLTHASHAAGTAKCGADIYAVGALISVAGIEREAPMLEGYARDHNMIVAFSNYAKPSGAYTPAGKSAIWSAGGALIAAAEGTEECLVVATKVAEGWRGQILPL